MYMVRERRSDFSRMASECVWVANGLTHSRFPQSTTNLVSPGCGEYAN
jgi:hypothetical protein